MAVISRQYADFAQNRVIDASGIANVNFPTTCNSLVLYLGTDIGTPFHVMLNFENQSQGPDPTWNKNHMILPAGLILTIPAYEITSLQVIADMGSNFSCWGFVTPGDAPYVSYTYTG